MKQKIKREDEMPLRLKAGLVFYLLLFLYPLLIKAQTTSPVVYRSLSPKTNTTITVDQMIHLDYGYFYKGLNIDLSGGIKANPGATNSSSMTLAVYAYDESKADGKGTRVFYCWATPQQLAATTDYVKSVENVQLNTLTGVQNPDGSFFGYSTTSDDIKKIGQDVKAYIPNYCTSYDGTIFWRGYVKIANLLGLTGANPEDYCNSFLKAQQPVIVEMSTSNLAAFKEAKVPGIIGGKLNVINSIVVTSPPSQQVDNTSICAQESSELAVEITTYVKLWPRGEISYFFDPTSNFSVSEKKAVTDAMAEWVSVIGSNRIRFMQAASLNDAKVPIKRGVSGGCSTERLGYPAAYSKVNTLNLSGTCDHVSILHELGHILGLQHEHQRTIRSNYLIFPAKTYQYMLTNFPNIYDGAVYNLRQEKVVGYTDNFLFDITSVMFYASYPRNNIPLRDALIANSLPLFTDKSCQLFSRPTGISKKDSALVKSLYPIVHREMRRSSPSDENISNGEDIQDFQIVPNPNNGSFDIRLQQIESGLVTVEIFNLAGESVNRFSNTYSPGKITIPVNFRSSPGMYIVIVSAEGQAKSYTKFIVQ